MDIIIEGNDRNRILRQSSNEVVIFDLQLHSLIENMIKTMRLSGGVGLAAPQVGVQQRVCIVEYSNRLFEFINPKIIKSNGRVVKSEQCLSLPNIDVEVARFSSISVDSQNRYGKTNRVKAYNMLARIFQHEFDHLDGILITDYA